MTVSYTGDVANSSTFGCFNKIMGKWRGSVYKLVYKELLAYISCYFVINMTYRMIIVPKSECNLAFDGDTCMRWKTHRELFEQVDLEEFDFRVKNQNFSPDEALHQCQPEAVSPHLRAWILRGTKHDYNSRSISICKFSRICY